MDVAMPTKAQPHFSFTALDGTVLGLTDSPCHEPQPRQRYRLKKGATYWDYAPLLDVVRRVEASQPSRSSSFVEGQNIQHLALAIPFIR